MNKEEGNEKEMSYEEEQIQQILIEESEKQKILMDRELRETQEREYQESLKIDTNKFHEPSSEEMRRVRLLRFTTYKSIKG